MWIFGYGSLIWRPSFDYHERAPGVIRGYVRRFWQGSTDHRGTPEAPGCVVTLIECADAACWGMVYRVAHTTGHAILDALDVREQDGYERMVTDVHLQGNRPTVRAHMYIATPANPRYLGPTAIDELAARIRTAHGPSGTNLDYLQKLSSALSDMGASDPHVSELLAHLVGDG